MKKTFILAIAALALIPLKADAHLRNFLDTYGTSTLEEKHYEMEFYTDLRSPDKGEDYWWHQTEFEYGLTDRWTMGAYAVLIEGKGFSAFKLENRYRLRQIENWPFQTALYFEIQDANGRKEADELEGKLLLSKEFPDWSVAINPILELEREVKPNGNDAWEAEPGISLGAAYKMKGRVTPGIEFFSTEKKTRLTPGVYIDIAPDVRLNLGVGIGLESAADDTQLKSILELEF